MAFEFNAAMSNSSFPLITYGLNEFSDVVSNDSIFKDFYREKNESGYDSFTCEPFLTSGSVLQAEWFKNTAYFLYGIVFVVALVGNALVCYVVWSIPQMRTVTNYFIVNLAVSDILMTLFCVPTSFLSTLILQYWPFGAELCPSVNYAQVRILFL